MGSVFYMDYVNGNDANSGADWANAWKTITSGATAARIAPGDVVRIAKSPAPSALGTAQWTNLSKTITLQALTSCAFSDSGATLVRVTKAGHGFANGSVVTVSSSTDYDGDWVISYVSSSAFDLVGSTYSADRSGTVTPKLTCNIDMCESAWTGTTGLITVLNATPTAGGSGYAVNDTFNITTGGTGAIGIVTTVSATVVTGVAIVSGGNGGYTTGAGKATTKISGGGNNALTVNITTVASVTVALTGVATDGKEGSNCMKITNPANIKAGSKLAYFAITPGSLAKYQKISFWIYNNSAITAGQRRVVLCSGATGETIVDEFLMPAIPSSFRRSPVTITKTGGGNLGASIASIAIYSDTVAPTSASYVYIDDFVACTTSGISLQSLISKNSLEQGGTEARLGIQSINGNTILLDNDTNTKASAGRGYYGTTEIVPTYIRETIKTAMASAGGNVPVQEIQDSGTSGSNIEFQGGYNTSGPDTRDGETFFDGLNGFGHGIYNSSKSYITLNYLNMIRYNSGIYLTATTYNTITTINNMNNCSGSGITLFGASDHNTFGTITNICNNTSGGVILSTASNNLFTSIVNASSNLATGINFSGGSHNTVTTISNANNNTQYGVSISSPNNIITTISNSNYNTISGVIVGGGNNIITTISNSNYNVSALSFGTGSYNKIGSITTTGNTSYTLLSSTSTNYIGTLTSAETILGVPLAAALFSNNFVATNKFNGNYAKIFSDGGNIVSQASTLTNGSGTERKLTTETNANRQLVLNNYPLTLSIAKIAVTANNLVTVKGRFKKGHATDIGAKLVCRVGQIAWSDGTSDVTATKADDTSEEELTITFTPTEAGVVEIEARAYINASAVKTDVVFSNPSSTTVLGTYVGHGLTTGNVVSVEGCTQAYANATWTVTRIDDDTFTLDSADWTLFTGADVTGTVTRHSNVIVDALTITQA